MSLAVDLQDLREELAALTISVNTVTNIGNITQSNGWNLQAKVSDLENRIRSLESLVAGMASGYTLDQRFQVLDHNIAQLAARVVQLEDARPGRLF